MQKITEFEVFWRKDGAFTGLRVGNRVLGKRSVESIVVKVPTGLITIVGGDNKVVLKKANAKKKKPEESEKRLHCLEFEGEDRIGTTGKTDINTLTWRTE